jgi:hypothetical protein
MLCYQCGSALIDYPAVQMCSFNFKKLHHGAELGFKEIIHFFNFHLIFSVSAYPQNPFYIPKKLFFHVLNEWRSKLSKFKTNYILLLKLLET